MDNFWQADWEGLYRFFTSGNPPLALQLLAVNTIFFILFLVRNAAVRRPMTASSAHSVQAMLLFANVVVIFKGDTFEAFGKMIG